MTASFAIECLVAVLLAVTIGYCIVLNRRLKRLRDDEQALRATIGELIAATEIAERAIQGLRATVADAESNLGEKLSRAEQATRSIDREMQAADALLRRLAQISGLARDGGGSAVRERAPFHRGPERRA